EHVYFVGGHVHYTYGDYKNELEREHPGMHARLAVENALEPPTGAPESWKAAIPAEHHYNTAIADRTIEYIRAHNADRPFFIWCSFPDPHHPFAVPRPYCDQYDPKAITFSPARRDGELDDLPAYIRECYKGLVATGGLDWDMRPITDEHFREMIAHTYGMISMVDDNIGRVVKALEELALLENTIIVFFSDHGDLMGDHWLSKKGPFLFRTLTRIPTVWRLPKRFNARRESDALVSTVDLMPTLLDLAGVPIPDGVQGLSYRQVMTGEQ
ncbi:unnamed protein product, partial [marine sediment metagenome]